MINSFYCHFALYFYILPWPSWALPSKCHNSKLILLLSLGAILDFDGGKNVATSGEFNKLDMYSKEDWDQIANLIRTKAKSS